MSSQLPNINPTAYLGSRATNPPALWIRKVDPVPTDYNNYEVGDIWVMNINNGITTPKIWMLAEKLAGVAFWVFIGGIPGNLIELTPDTGFPVTPVANNIDLFGIHTQGVFTSQGGPGIIDITVVDATVGAQKGVARFDPAFFTAVAGFISLTGLDAFTWNRVTTNTQAMLPNNGYWNAFAGPSTFTLPAVCPINSIIRVAGVNAGGWVLAQNAGQRIISGNMTSTLGASGGLQATFATDSVELLCITANSLWTVISQIGNPQVN